MKKTPVILTILLISIKGTACIREWSGNFLQIANNSELIIKGNSYRRKNLKFSYEKLKRQIKVV